MTARTLIRFAISAVVFAVFLLHAARIVPMRLLDTVENFTYDARILLTLPHTPDPRIVIVDIDERSMEKEGQFPWRRDKMALLMNQLFDRYKIRALGMDVFYPEPDDRGTRVWDELVKGGLAGMPGLAEIDAGIREQFNYDRQFADALKNRLVVLGYFFKQAVPKNESATVGGICAPLVEKTAAKLYAIDFLQPAGFGGNVPVLQEATPLCGFVDNPIVDNDGVYRRVPLMQMYEGSVYPSIALALTRATLGNPPVEFQFDPPDVRDSLHLERVALGPVRTSSGDQYLTAPVDERVAVYVPYRGDNRTFTYISATDVLQGTVAHPQLLLNTVVLLGTTAAGLLDFRTTPVNKVFAGVEVHANIVSGILDGRILQKAPYYNGIETTLLLLIALLMAWAFTRLTAAYSAMMAASLVVGLVSLALGLWAGANFIMPLGVPVLFTLTVFMAHLLYGYFIESRGKREISKLFGQYVPPELVEEMAAHPEEISMEGESRDMTVLFSDVRNFTSISEKLEAKDLAAMMNAYLTKQTAMIQKHRGTIDKYIGDAIMAFWGAPLPDKESALHGVNSALDMVRAVRELDEDFEKRGWPKLNIGVGVNTGKMNVGNMGSSFRMAYTVMGDAVNLGARLEGLTKEYGAAILISEYTRNALPGDWAFRELDLVRVKGKKEPVAIYEPLGPKEALDPAVRQDLARHRGVLKLYRSQLWDQAETEFFNLSQQPGAHPVYAKFIDRIMFFRESPPGNDWDGAWNFEHK
ncbi:MAG TPA: adenylate/guanylate cyclase domain-containing protein [Solimonas sp.]|nr:adenylate/guanylate cyclase domain-containing protein [Solimonas sp.]